MIPVGVIVRALKNLRERHQNKKNKRTNKSCRSENEENWNSSINIFDHTTPSVDVNNENNIFISQRQTGSTSSPSRATTALEQIGRNLQRLNCPSNSMSDNGLIDEFNEQYTDTTGTGNTSTSAGAVYNNTQNKIPFVFQLAKNWAWEAVRYRCITHPQEIPYSRSTSHDVTGEEDDNILHWCAFGNAPLSVVQIITTICPALVHEPNSSHGNLPIHSACSYRSSYGIIQTLLNIHPQSLCEINACGATPIYLLCDYGCSIEVFHLLLSYSQSPASLRATRTKRNDLNGSSHHSCAQNDLNRSSHHSYSHQTENQQHPLLLLNSRKNLKECHNYLESLRKLRHLQLELGHSLYTNDNIEELNELTTIIEQMESYSYWQKVCRLLIVEYTQEPLQRMIINIDEHTGHIIQNDNNFVFDNNNTNDDVNNFRVSDYSIIMACLCNPFCFLSFLEMAMYMYPHQLLVPDTSGNLPIHVAALTSSSVSNNTFNNKYKLKKQLPTSSLTKRMTSSKKKSHIQQQEQHLRDETKNKSINGFHSNMNAIGIHIIPEMITLYPQSVFVRNNQGQLPFECYVKPTTITTVDIDALLCKAPSTLYQSQVLSSSPPCWSHTLESLLYANPKALSEVVSEGIVFLYPHIWSQMCQSLSKPSSASSMTTTTTKTSLNKKVDCYNTIFQCLRQNPTWFG